jgi:hypothetical protein
MSDLFSFFSPGHQHEKPSIQPLLIEIDINEKLFFGGLIGSSLSELGYEKKKKKVYSAIQTKYFELVAEPTPTCQLEPTEEG